VVNILNVYLTSAGWVVDTDYRRESFHSNIVHDWPVWIAAQVEIIEALKAIEEEAQQVVEFVEETP
jgi:hypothetical protein